MTEPVERFLPKPVLVDTLETRLGRAIPVHPHVLSALKLLVVTPLIAAGLLGGVEALRSTGAVIGLFCAFGVLDALDGIVARAHGLDTDAGRMVDRLTDLPLLLIVGVASFSVLPPGLVVAKLALDVLSLVLFVVKRRTTENRVRTTLTDATILAMLLLSLGRLDALVTRELVSALLLANVGFTALVVLFQLGVLQKRFIADALSGANALCGVASIYFASQQKIEASLLLLVSGRSVRRARTARQRASGAARASGSTRTTSPMESTTPLRRAWRWPTVWAARRESWWARCTPPSPSRAWCSSP
jgi:phosphatidylglycerophosphate synthase